MAFNPNPATSSSMNNLYMNPMKPPNQQLQNQSPVPGPMYNQLPSNMPPVAPGYSNVPNNPNGFSNPSGTTPTISPVTRPPLPSNVYQNNASLNSSRNSSPALNYSGHSNSPVPHQLLPTGSGHHSPAFMQGNLNQSNLKNLPPPPQISTSLTKPNEPPSHFPPGIQQPTPISYSQTINQSLPHMPPPVKPQIPQFPPPLANMPPNRAPPNVPISQPTVSQPPLSHTQQPISNSHSFNAPPFPQPQNRPQMPGPPMSQTSSLNQTMPPNRPPQVPYNAQMNPSNLDTKGTDRAPSNLPPGTSSLPFPNRQINSTMPPLIPSQVSSLQQTMPNPYSSVTSLPPSSNQNQNLYSNQNKQQYPPMNPAVSQPNYPITQPPQMYKPAAVQTPDPGQPKPNLPQQQYGNVNQQPVQYGSTNHYNGQQDLSQQMGRMNIHQTGFNKLWGHETVDLLQCRNIMPEGKIEPPVIKLNNQFANSKNCSPEIFRCTLTRIPETNSLLQKSRLPLGILIHPFKDLTHLPVIQCSAIVRCRSCRTYINPFVYFIDLKKWKCNLCYRVNDLPEEFQYDPVTKTYGDPTRRPEIQSATIEYIAPSEYMLRPPQPAAYLFLFDVSASAAESGYLKICCDTLIEQIDNLPGDSRTQLAFICYDSSIHFYFLGENASRPKEMTVIDIDDVFLPSPEDLLVNLAEKRSAILELLAALPERHGSPSPAATQSALGAALQAAYKLMSATGGRITVFQSCLPNVGPGALTAREDPNNRSSKDVAHLNPATDFYKRLALDCSGVQIAVDLFLLNSQYADLSTISGISRYSGGTIYHIPLFKSTRDFQAQELKRCFTRYLTRKIGFEAVMRVRFSRGLAIHAFHGSFFVRSTDLLSLPNVSPDAGFGMQLAIEESLSDVQHVCFQAALLYTSSKGERRIRVHTLCLPVVATLTDIIHSADQQCIAGLLAKMAVDRSQTSSLSDAREALINAAVDALGTVKVISGPSHGLMCPMALRLLPLYLLSLLKHTSFRTGTSTRLDDRVAAMCEMKSLPLGSLLRSVYPDLYPVHRLADFVQTISSENEGEGDEITIPNPPRLRLSAEKVSATGAYLLDQENIMILYIGHTVHPSWIQNALGVEQHSHIRDDVHSIPTIETEENALLHAFIDHLNDEKPFAATLYIIRDNSSHRTMFTERLVDDRVESALSYYEFLQHIKAQMK